MNIDAQNFGTLHENKEGDTEKEYEKVINGPIFKVIFYVFLFSKEVIFVDELKQISLYASLGVLSHLDPSQDSQKICSRPSQLILAPVFA